MNHKDRQYVLNHLSIDILRGKHIGKHAVNKEKGFQSLVNKVLWYSSSCALKNLITNVVDNLYRYHTIIFAKTI